MIFIIIQNLLGHLIYYDFTKKGIFLSFFSKAINLRKGKAEHRSFSRELMEQMERPAGMHAGFG